MVAAISPAQPLKNEFFKQHRSIIHSLCVLVAIFMAKTFQLQQATLADVIVYILPR